MSDEKRNTFTKEILIQVKLEEESSMTMKR